MYVYWLNMQEHVARIIRESMLCSTSKPSNGIHGLCNPFLIPTCPWENISMVFVRGLPKNRKGHDYHFVVVDRFNKMCVMMRYRMTIDGKEVLKFLFG